MAFKSFKELKEQKDKVSVKEVQEKTVRAQAGLISRLPILFVKKEQATAVKFLHSFDKGVDLLVHKVYEPATRSTKYRLCGEHYNDICSLCGEGSYATPTRCLISYACSLIGQEWIMVDPVTKEKKTGAYNLIRLALISLGKNDANIKALVQASREKIFNERIWLLSKSPKTMKFKDESKIVYVQNPPEIVYEDEYTEKLGLPYPEIELSPVAEKITKMDSEAVLRLILTAFDGVDIDRLLGGPEKKAEPVVNNAIDELAFESGDVEKYFED